MHYERPRYSVVIYAPNGNKYFVKKMGKSKLEESNVVTSLTLTESEGQLAQKVSITMMNKHINGFGYPSTLFPVRSRVYVYAKGVGKNKTTEVFRGFIWDTNLKNGSNGSEYSIICYDRLIYFMNTEILMYFSKGKSTKTIVTEIFKKKGVKLKYDYTSMTHPKLPLQGNLADILTSDILEEVRKKKGTRYVIRNKKDTVYIETEGQNVTRYQITRGAYGTMIDYTRSVTMDGMVTKVIITGKTEDNDKTKIEARVSSKHIKDYGTLTKIINKDEDTKLSTIKSEARYILKENENPKKEYEVSCMDIPWVRKGDRIGVGFNKSGFTWCMVKEITHNCDDSTMHLVVRKLKKLKNASGKGDGTLVCPSKTLRKGSQGTGVKNLQKCLNNVMSSGLTVDGIFGENTLKAVKAFQKKYKLVVDGIFGPKSIAKMKSALK